MMKVDGLRNGDTLNVREGAGAQFADIGDLQFGEIVDVKAVDSSGKWGQIVYRGQVAYVSMKYLNSVLRADGGSTSTGTFWVTGIKVGDPDGGLVVRAQAGVDFDAIGVLVDGAEVHVIQRSDDGKWAMIAFGAGIGWVSSAYLSGTNSHGSQPLPATDAGHGPDGTVLPSIYSVTGVAADDVLWVRAEPNAKSTPIDGLAPNAPVAVLSMETSQWAKVSVGSQTGYVNVKFLTQGGGVSTSSGLPLNLLCRGTEPFWTLDIDADRTVTYTLMDAAAQSSTLSQATPSPLTGSYPYTIAAQPFSGVIQQEMCSDGMSDIAYPWSIVLNAPNAVGVPMTAYGCCTLR
ncbi:SH3 domain-containing protein [Celeribacter baekdonensis]|uniref:SH3 domain-containing protein n=1 Tax=Celeribacter baekdonensis TaxID=875171 RepID=UPI003A8E90BB